VILPPSPSEDQAEDAVPTLLELAIFRGDPRIARSLGTCIRLDSRRGETLPRFRKIFDTREGRLASARGKRDYVRSERSSSRKLLDFSSRADVFIYSSSSIIAPRVRRTSLTVLVCLSVYNGGKERERVRERGKRRKERTVGRSEYQEGKQ